jgi:hypothetical protein
VGSPHIITAYNTISAHTLAPYHAPPVITAIADMGAHHSLRRLPVSNSCAKHTKIGRTGNYPAAQRLERVLQMPRKQLDSYGLCPVLPLVSSLL